MSIPRRIRGLSAFRPRDATRIGRRLRYRCSTAKVKNWSSTDDSFDHTEEPTGFFCDCVRHFL
ncbi:hypothetical protein [Streptomyces sp. NPDC048357]|uniref:hypothetical protein n=1 Tax=Streptomyces sp. NPDC048357 TaxID=3154719 RepID=UPI0034222433